MSDALTPAKALIFRIVHRDNLQWILDHGLHARNGQISDPHYRSIGNPDLIDKRSRRQVRVGPGGTLSDYVSFYFTPYSIMLFNIKTGYGGVQRTPNEEIVIFVSSLHHLAELQIPFVFTNQHAYPLIAGYFTDMADLTRIDWPLLQNRNFKHDPDDPGKKERYQAEALVWKHVPLEALLGVCCYSAAVAEYVETLLEARRLKLTSLVKPGWYF
jgi:hypothetical protein